MTPQFLTMLQGEWLDDVRFQLLAPLIYDSEVAGQTITVPVGFVTDFASVPRVPIIYGLFGDRAHHESVLHDWLYKSAVVSRKVADAVFLEAMNARSKGFFVRWGMWLGVRIGGWKAWDDHRKEDQKN